MTSFFKNTLKEQVRKGCRWGQNKLEPISLKTNIQRWEYWNMIQDPENKFNLYRFSAFWLRSKCSICSYQLNIWYEGHVPSLMLIWFLWGDGVLELALTPLRVGLVLQYHQDQLTSPILSFQSLFFISSLKTSGMCRDEI